MVSIFGVNFPRVIKGAFGGQLESGTLHRTTEAIDDYGDVSLSYADEAIECYVGKWDDRLRISRGWPAETSKVLILASDVARPTTRDEITVRGQRWRVLDVMDGGAEAIWNVAGVSIPAAIIVVGDPIEDGAGNALTTADNTALQVA